MIRPDKYVNQPTALDHMQAHMYASTRIMKDKCLSPEIKQKYSDLTWVPEPGFIQCPKGLKDCGYGHCKIGKTSCANLSFVPWDKVTGQLYATGPSGYISPDGEIIPHDKLYLEWRASSPAGPSGEQTEGKCVWGDANLRKYCNWPKTRSTKSKVGVTDVPPFNYCANNGQCLMSDPYCHWMEVHFRGDTGEKACKEYPTNEPHCYETEGEKIAEKYFFGKTIFRGIKKFFSPGTSVGFGAAALVEMFKKNPPPRSVSKMMDTKLMDSYKNIGPDFAGPGINLYAIQWNADAILADEQITEGGTIGILAEEVKKKYPELVKTKNGLKWIEITIDDVIKNKDLKRMYLVCTSGKWLLQNLLEFSKA